MWQLSFLNRLRVAWQVILGRPVITGVHFTGQDQHGLILGPQWSGCLTGCAFFAAGTDELEQARHIEIGQSGAHITLI